MGPSSSTCALLPAPPSKSGGQPFASASAAAFFSLMKEKEGQRGFGPTIRQVSMYSQGPRLYRFERLSLSRHSLHLGKHPRPDFGHLSIDVPRCPYRDEEGDAEDDPLYDLFRGDARRLFPVKESDDRRKMVCITEAPDGTGGDGWCSGAYSPKTVPLAIVNGIPSAVVSLIFGADLPRVRAINLSHSQVNCHQLLWHGENSCDGEEPPR